MTNTPIDLNRLQGKVATLAEIVGGTLNPRGQADKVSFVLIVVARDDKEGNFIMHTNTRASPEDIEKAPCIREIIAEHGIDINASQKNLI